MPVARQRRKGEREEERKRKEEREEKERKKEKGHGVICIAATTWAPPLSPCGCQSTARRTVQTRSARPRTAVSAVRVSAVHCVYSGG